MLKRLLMAVCLMGVAASCASGSPDQGSSEQVGSVRLPLITTGSSGTEYRLEAARIRFTNADGLGTTLTAPPEDPTFEVNQDVGTYSVELLDGWDMIRVAPDGTTREVAATLVSENPLTGVEIQDGLATDILFLFNVGAETIPFGTGNAIVAIGVNETGAPACTFENSPAGGCTVGDQATCVCTGCNDDGVCGNDDDCTCSDCDANSFCSTNCDGDGVCNPWVEGCACADCATQAECRPFICDLTKSASTTCGIGDAEACSCEGCDADDTTCSPSEDCTCATCDSGSVCNGCNDDGECKPWTEGCACADCAQHPLCN